VIDPNLLLGVSLGLSPIRARIFAVMAKHRELQISRLIIKVYGGPDGGCTNATMQGHIHHLNKVIKRIGLCIRANQGDAFTTYRLMKLT
jgi:hypothetical protein